MDAEMEGDISINSEQVLDQYRNLTQTRLRDIMAEYGEPETLYQPMNYVLEGEGKRIRPLLVLLTNRALGGPEEEALNVAAALEILHNFTLVHDDIMDEDTKRRGRPTVHHKWDVSTGILSGDGLLALAYRTLLGAEVKRTPELVRIFTDGLMEICEGQALDKEFETRESVSLEEYLEMISKKTGALLAICCRMGGMVAAANAKTCHLLEEFGYELGKAFQIQDDLLEVTSTSDVMGKSLGSDLFAQKKTYVILRALEMADSETEFNMQQLLNRTSYTSDDFDMLRDYISQLGVVEETRAKVEQTIATARGILRRVDGDMVHVEYLTDRLLQRRS